MLYTLFYSIYLLSLFFLILFCLRSSAGFKRPKAAVATFRCHACVSSESRHINFGGNFPVVKRTFPAFKLGGITSTSALTGTVPDQSRGIPVVWDLGRRKGRTIAVTYDHPVMADPHPPCFGEGAHDSLFHHAKW